MLTGEIWDDNSSENVFNPFAYLFFSFNLLEANLKRMEEILYDQRIKCGFISWVLSLFEEKNKEIDDAVYVQLIFRVCTSQQQFNQHLCGIFNDVVVINK